MANAKPNPKSKPPKTEPEIWATQFEPKGPPPHETALTSIDAKRVPPGEIRKDLLEPEKGPEMIELQPEEIKLEAEADARDTEKEIEARVKWTDEYTTKSEIELPQETRKEFVTLRERVKRALSAFLDRLRGITQKLKETPEEQERGREEEALKQRLTTEEDALEREREKYEEETRLKLATLDKAKAEKEKAGEERARQRIGQVEIDQSQEPAPGPSFELKPEFETTPAADISSEEQQWFDQFKNGKINQEVWNKILIESAANQYTRSAFEIAQAAGLYTENIARMEQNNNEEELLLLAEELDIIWSEQIAANAARMPRRERSLYKKALRGEGLPEEHTAFLDFIAADMKNARKALRGIEEKKIRAAAELEKEIKEAYRPPEKLPSEPESVPDIETRKEEIVELTKQKPESKYDAVLPAELILLRQESIKTIEARLRELDRLAGSYDMRQAAGLSMTQVEREAEILLQRRAELQKGFIPDDAVRERIKTAEHQNRFIAGELSKLRVPEAGKPETAEEELRRNNLLAEGRAQIQSVRDMRGYLEEGLPIDIEGATAAPQTAETEAILELTKKKELPTEDKTALETTEEVRESSESFETDKIEYIDLSAELEFLRRKEKRTPPEDQRVAELKQKIGDPPNFWRKHALQATDAEILRIQEAVVRRYFEIKTSGRNRAAA